MSNRIVNWTIVAAVVMALVAAVPAGSALAGGGGGEQASIRLAYPAFNVTATGELVMTSAVTCDLPGEAWISAFATQPIGVGGPEPGGRVHGFVVSGSGSGQVTCAAGDVVGVEIVIPPDLARGFRTGEAIVTLEFAYDALKPDGTHEQGYMWGELYPTLQQAS